MGAKAGTVASGPKEKTAESFYGFLTGRAPLPKKRERCLSILSAREPESLASVVNTAMAGYSEDEIAAVCYLLICSGEEFEAVSRKLGRLSRDMAVALSLKMSEAKQKMSKQEQT